MLIDGLSIIVFFVAYRCRGIYVATGLVLAIVLLHVLYKGLRGKKITLGDGLKLGLVVVLGGSTCLLRNPWFIKLKPTCLYWGIALFCLLYPHYKQITFVEQLLKKEVDLQDPHFFRRLNWVWVIFFTLLGVVNLIIAYCCPTDIWVYFKLFGLLGLIIVFVLVQAYYLQRKLDQ